MDREGPHLEQLLRRIAETPEDFRGEPRIGQHGAVFVPAVVGDLCRQLGAPLPDTALARFAGSTPRKDRNRLQVTLIVCWLLTDDWFEGARLSADAVLSALEAGPRELAAQTPSGKFLHDPDRREELARFTLARLGLRPGGETVAQAQDRLTSLSATERTRVMQAAKQAEARARAIREQLARKAAEESADKWTRE